MNILASSHKSAWINKFKVAAPPSIITDCIIPQVVIASPDPFDAVNGKGILKLKSAGIKVTENFCVDKANFINRRFFTRISKQRPYFILKWAPMDWG